MEIAEMPVRRTVILSIVPMAKPRMTRKDTWKPKPVVVKYRLWKDKLRDELFNAGLSSFPVMGAHVTFHMPMPRSWSSSKKTKMLNEPHRQRPDVDNLLKGLLDGVYDKRGEEKGDDCEVWDIHITKVWTETETGRIEIYYGI